MDVSLRDHFEQRFLDHGSVHGAEQRAVDLAREAIDKRLEKLNELRSEVQEDRQEYVRIDVYEAAKKSADVEHDKLSGQIRALENRLSRLMGGGAVVVFVATGLGALVSRLLSH